MDTLRILIVDDEPGMRAGVRRALRRFTLELPAIEAEVDFEVETAETGEEGLAKVNAAAPDILLLDHKLPGMTGLEVLQQIGRHEGLLTIMITAYASLETAVSAIKSGAYDFLAKPFTPKELKAAVRKAAETLMHARQARKLAEEKRRVRFQFTSVLAHELKAPLNAIEGYLNIIRDRSAGDDEEAYRMMAGRCVDRIEGMRKMILDLLDLTRIESGQKRRELQEIDLVELVRTAFETARPAADERGIELVFEREEPLPMRADRGELEIILNNLVSNAVKYNRDNGRVTVTLDADEKRVTLRVSDTGIGMSPEETKKLFGDFVRIKNPKTRNVLGSGLGLAIIKKIAELYDGDVTVESQPDVGTTFTLTLSDPPEDAGADPTG